MDTLFVPEELHEFPSRSKSSRSIPARGSTAQAHCLHESVVMVVRERDQSGVALHSTTLECSVVRAVLGELHGPPRRGRSRRQRVGLDAFVLNSIEEQLTGLDYDSRRVGRGDAERWQAASLVPTLGDEVEIEEVEMALAEARAELDEYLNDTELRAAEGAAKHTEAAASYVAVVAKCEADMRAAHERHTGGWELVGRLWINEWGNAERAEWVARVVREVVVSRGREPLSRRVEVELR